MSRIINITSLGRGSTLALVESGPWRRALVIALSTTSLEEYRGNRLIAATL